MCCAIKKKTGRTCCLFPLLLCCARPGPVCGNGSGVSFLSNCSAQRRDTEVVASSYETWQKTNEKGKREPGWLVWGACLPACDLAGWRVRFLSPPGHETLPSTGASENAGYNWVGERFLSFMLVKICVFFSNFLYGFGIRPRPVSVKKRPLKWRNIFFKVLEWRHDDSHFDVSGAIALGKCITLLKWQLQLSVLN